MCIIDQLYQIYVLLFLLFPSSLLFQCLIQHRLRYLHELLHNRSREEPLLLSCYIRNDSLCLPCPIQMFHILHQLPRYLIMVELINQSGLSQLTSDHLFLFQIDLDELLLNPSQIEILCHLLLMDRYTHLSCAWRHQKDLVEFSLEIAILSQ